LPREYAPDRDGFDLFPNAFLFEEAIKGKTEAAREIREAIEGKTAQRDWPAPGFLVHIES
jgi:hypothetical protein